VTKRAHWLLLLALTALGCGDRALPTGSALGSTTVDQKQPGEQAPASAPAGCNATGGAEITFANEGDALSRLAGSWLLCSGPGLAFATEQSAQAGVELGGDKGWHVLRAAGQELSRSDGFQASGAFIFPQPQDLMIGPSGTATLFFGVDWSFAEVTMLDSPRKMRVKFSAPLDQTPSIYVFIQ
jgi:hypothetical protein